MTFADQLRKARQDAGLSQQAAADLAGVNIRTYQRWEAGDNEPSFSTATCLLYLLREHRPKPSRATEQS